MRTHVTWMMALTMMASPAISLGAETAATKTEAEYELRNVELTPAGSLEGQVLAADGSAIKGAKVIVRSQANPQKVGQQLATDDKGRFLATGLKSGACVLEADGQTFAVRVWKKGTAPPKSLQNIAMVQPADETVRGQSLTDNRIVNRIRSMTRGQKIACGVLLAAAIVIPIALDDDGS